MVPWTFVMTLTEKPDVSGMNDTWSGNFLIDAVIAPAECMTK